MTFLQSKTEPSLAPFNHFHLLLEFMVILTIALLIMTMLYAVITLVTNNKRKK